MKENDNISYIPENEDMLDDLQKMLDEELAKPDELINFDYVSEITQAIAEISGGGIDAAAVEERAEEITEKIISDQKRSRITKLYKWASIISACFVFVIALNFYTLSSFGTDLFTTALQVTQNGFSLDFSKDFDNEPVSATTAPINNNPQTISTVQTTAGITTTAQFFHTEVPVTTFTRPEAMVTTTTAPDDTLYPITGTTVNAVTTTAESATTTATQQTDIPPLVVATTEPATVPAEDTDISMEISSYAEQQGMNIGCFGYDFYSFLLNYAIDEEIWIEFSYEETELSKDIYVKMKSEKCMIDISAEQYFNKGDIPSQLIPSESYINSVISTSFGKAYIFEEDNQKTAVFVCDNTVYTIVCYETAVNETENIVYSFIPSDYSEN